MSSRIDKAVQWALAIAADNSHGYDQDNRWGPDYDCSSLVISAFENAGIPVKTNGATYTGDMKKVFLKNGFRNVIKNVDLSTGEGLRYGDVLLKEGHHTAISLGNGYIVHASINEKGKIEGGQTGDQTGGEICVRDYYNKPWNAVLRYTAADPEEIFVPSDVATCSGEGVNIRSGGSVDCDILTTVKRGTSLEVDGTKENGWYHVRANGVVGYMSPRYVKFDDFQPYLVFVQSEHLNIRTGPGITNERTGFTGRGVFTIVDEADGTGAAKWGLLKSYVKERDGWISLDYAKRL